MRNYVAGAVREGTIASATFRVRGDLWDFPFHDAKAARDGDFRIAAKVEGRDLRLRAGRAGARPTAGAARESWPPLTGGSGEIVVDRSTLDIRGAQAQIGDVEWSGCRAGSPSSAAAPRLDIDGTARGPLADMLRFVDVTPIGRWTGKALSGATRDRCGRAQARARRAADATADSVARAASRSPATTSA